MGRLKPPGAEPQTMTKPNPRFRAQDGSPEREHGVSIGAQWGETEGMHIPGRVNAQRVRTLGIQSNPGYATSPHVSSGDSHEASPTVSAPDSSGHTRCAIPGPMGAGSQTCGNAQWRASQTHLR
jgi:hypothetical protein